MFIFDTRAPRLLGPRDNCSCRASVAAWRVSNHKLTGVEAIRSRWLAIRWWFYNWKLLFVINRLECFYPFFVFSSMYFMRRPFQGQRQFRGFSRAPASGNDSCARPGCTFFLLCCIFGPDDPRKECFHTFVREPCTFSSWTCVVHFSPDKIISRIISFFQSRLCWDVQISWWKKWKAILDNCRRIGNVNLQIYFFAYVRL